jgi:hypothetical protein
LRTRFHFLNKLLCRPAADGSRQVVIAFDGVGVGSTDVLRKAFQLAPIRIAATP